MWSRYGWHITLLGRCMRARYRGESHHEGGFEMVYLELSAGASFCLEHTVFSVKTTIP